MYILLKQDIIYLSIDLVEEKNVRNLQKPMYITQKHDTIKLTTTNFIQSEETRYETNKTNLVFT